MTWLTESLMQAVLAVTAGVMLGMLATVVAQRALRHRREREHAELDRRIRPLVLTATVAEEDEIACSPPAASCAS